MLNFLLGVLVTFAVIATAWLATSGIPFLQIAQATGSLAIAVSAAVALNVYMATVRRHKAEDQRSHSKEYLSQALVAIERSFEIFTDRGANTYPPRNDRALWLTAARFIARFWRLGDKITERDHLDVYEEHEEYWRNKYATLLADNRENFALEYLMPDGDRYAGNVVHRDSIAVVFHFAKWPEDNDDPLSSLDTIDMHAQGAVPIHFHDIHHYIEGYEPYYEKIEARRAELDPDNDGAA